MIYYIDHYNKRKEDIDMKKFNKYFDHTLLKPESTQADIKKLCKEAAEYDFASVCINSCYVKTAAENLKNTHVKITSVAGFPLGAMTTEAKAFEIENALSDGANEIDIVINIGALKDCRYDYIENELSMLSDLCHKQNAQIKVILETCLLSNDEIIKACEIASSTGVDFVKTSTGFSEGGAYPHHVELMAKSSSDNVKVKASGGIKTLEDALKMIEAGADRLGCSASVSIMKDYLNKK